MTNLYSSCCRNGRSGVDSWIAGAGATDLEGRIDADRDAVHVPRHQDQHHPGGHGRSHHRDRQGRRVRGADRADAVLDPDRLAYLQQDRHHLGRDVHHRAAQGGDRLLRARLHLRRGPDRSESRHQGLYRARGLQGPGGRRPGRHGLCGRAQEDQPVLRGEDLRHHRRYPPRREHRASQGRLRRFSDPCLQLAAGAVPRGAGGEELQVDHRRLGRHRRAQERR